MSGDWLISLATTPGVRADPRFGVSEEEIVAAETELGVSFPPSCRNRLRAYHDTRIGGGEIFGIAPAGPAQGRWAPTATSSG